MPPTGMRSLEGRLYRAALSLCPAGFRREHGDEMARDFDEARAEAVMTGDGALWILRLLIAVDLVRTFGVEWLRTRFPAIGLAALVATLALAKGALLVTVALAEGIAFVARRTTTNMPTGAPDAEILGVLFLAVICVVLIAMTLVLTHWVSRLSRRGRR